MIFLLQYDPRAGKLASIDKFEDDEVEAAQEASLAAELRAFKAGSGLEIVLLEADSIEVLKRSHSRYFRPLSDLVVQAKTLRDHFEQSAPGGDHKRLERICAIMVDGRRLGDYPLDGRSDREYVKRFEELQWLGIALVGCDADYEIQGIWSLSPGTKATPDFEAKTKQGAIIRLEVARITFDDERQQNEYFASIAGDAQAILEKVSDRANSGTFIYRVYDPRNTTIGKTEAQAAARELADFIQNDDRVWNQSTTLYPAGQTYPVLCQLGVHVCHTNDTPGPVSVLWDPLIRKLDAKGAVTVFERILKDKSQKYKDYSENGRLPVWLVFGVQSLGQKFLALSTVERLAQSTTVDPGPFQQVLVGCYTAGVTFSEPFVKPRYTSLTTTG